MRDTPYPSLPLLMIDDETTWLNRLALTLKRSAGINHVIKCSDSREVMELLARQEVAIILLDLTMPHLAGEELLPMIAHDYPDIPVIILSGMNQLETAVKCMKLGAFDYHVKTVESERLIASINRALSFQRLQRENRRLTARVLEGGLENPKAFSGIATQNEKMQSAFQYLEAVAGSSEPILITGESGVGKELIARAAHNLGRPEGPWVAVNVAGLDDNVFSDTLFGHTKGAFTGADRERRGMIEQAHSGTLFLDEIGDLNLASQLKLLRLLQEGEYFSLGSDQPKRTNARMVFATNQDLAKMQEKGDFRKDLYYRLCAHKIHIPPLRARSDDIHLLLDIFLEEAAEHLGKKKPTPPDELSVLLGTYHFPGNIRELRAMVFDAVSLHKGGKLSMNSFKKAIGQEKETGVVKMEKDTGASDFRPLLINQQNFPTLVEASNFLVTEAMRRSQDNQSIAAGLLGISQQALSKRLKKSELFDIG